MANVALKFFRSARKAAIASGLVAALLVIRHTAAAAEHVKVGLLPSVGDGAVYIAKDRGYFAQNGLDVEIVNFDAGQPIAVATVSGDLDFGAAGITSALYTLCGEGAARVIAGFTANRAGFHVSAVIESNQAYAGGLKSVSALAGHSLGLTQIGSTYHYAVSLIAAKNGFDLASMRMLPLQSMQNVASAVAGGQVDTGVLIAPIALPLVEKGAGRILSWTGDDAPFQVSVVWTSTKTANAQSDKVNRFLAAMHRGARDYMAAFLGADGKPKDDATAEAMLTLLAKYSTQTVAQEKLSLSYMDPDNRLDVRDLQRQIDWFRSQGMLKGNFNVEQVIDRRFVTPLPNQ